MSHRNNRNEVNEGFLHMTSVCFCFISNNSCSIKRSTPTVSNVDIIEAACPSWGGGVGELVAQHANIIKSLKDIFE